MSKITQRLKAVTCFWPLDHWDEIAGLLRWYSCV